MNLRDWPKGKSMPAIQGPGRCRASSNAENVDHSSRSPARSTCPSKMQRSRIRGLPRFGALVKSMPRTSMCGGDEKIDWIDHPDRQCPARRQTTDVHRPFRGARVAHFVKTVADRGPTNTGTACL